LKDPTLDLRIDADGFRLNVDVTMNAPDGSRLTDALEPGSRAAERLKRTLSRVGRAAFGRRLEVGLGVTAATLPFIRPAARHALWAKAGGFCLVMTGLGVRAWAAGSAGSHTRDSRLGGGKLATAGPYAHVRNPIYLGNGLIGAGMVLLLGDLRLLVPCAGTLLALYSGIIPAEEEFLSRRFSQEYEAYRRQVPRLLPRLSGWSGANEQLVEWEAARGEWRLGLVLALIWGAVQATAALRQT
jgi:protein-S-isoprenylcysteine O-methyltransferase Ste14